MLSGRPGDGPPERDYPSPTDFAWRWVTGWMLTSGRLTMPGEPAGGYGRCGDLRPASAHPPESQRTPRGRNCTLIRGPTAWDVFGTACSQVRWQLPPMISRSPWPISNRSEPPRPADPPLRG